MQSREELLRSLAKYDAIIMETRMSQYGYWQVVFSCAPGLYLTSTVCQTGITQTQARSLASDALRARTGQMVIK